MLGQGPSIGLGIGLTLSASGAFDPATLFGSSTQGAFYDPSDLSSMYQDSAGTTPAAVDSPVGKILDKSGRGNHATQATAAARPTLRRDSSGYLYLEFDGSDDYLRALFAITQPFDRISAIRQTTWTMNDVIFGGGNANRGVCYQGGTTPNVYMSSPTALGPAPLAVGANGIVSERQNGASSSITINNGTAVSGDVGTGVPGGITLGADNAGAAAGNIRLYGVCMIARALTTGETASLRAYAAAKAGVTL